MLQSTASARNNLALVLAQHVTQGPDALITLTRAAGFVNGGIIIVTGGEVAGAPVAKIAAAEKHVVVEDGLAMLEGEECQIVDLRRAKPILILAQLAAGIGKPAALKVRWSSAAPRAGSRATGGCFRQSSSTFQNG